MKKISLEVSLVLACLIAVVACDSGKPAGTAATSAGADTALMSPASSPGRADNDEGVGHYKQGHWDVATDWFKKAVKADANLAEAHYNLALSLDKMGKHEGRHRSLQKSGRTSPRESCHQGFNDPQEALRHVKTATLPRRSRNNIGPTHPWYWYAYHPQWMF